MKIIKIYETVINISAAEMYKGIDMILMSRLKQRFENKCEKNSLVINIQSIVRRSCCRLAKSRLDGSGDVDVQFKAESIIYNDNDILTNCEIQKIERGNKIICKYDRAVISVDGSRGLYSLKPGQKITIKISSVSYPQGKDKITINGAPYISSIKFNLYSASINLDITSENIELLKQKIQEIDDEYKLYESSDKKSIKFFNDIYYPYNQNFIDFKKNFKNTKIDLVDIYDLTKKLIISKKFEPNLILFRHTIIDKSTPLVFKINEEDLKSGITDTLLDKNSYNITFIREDVTFVLLALLNDYLSHIKTIREMTEIYITEQDIESHSNIWSIYNRLKK